MISGTVNVAEKLFGLAVRKEKLMRRSLPALALVLAALPALAAERWETLPPTPASIPTDRSGEVHANGISIHYAMYGRGQRYFDGMLVRHHGFKG